MCSAGDFLSVGGRKAGPAMDHAEAERSDRQETYDCVSNATLQAVDSFNGLARTEAGSMHDRGESFPDQNTSNTNWNIGEDWLLKGESKTNASAVDYQTESIIARNDPSPVDTFNDAVFSDAFPMKVAEESPFDNSRVPISDLSSEGGDVLFTKVGRPQIWYVRWQRTGELPDDPRPEKTMLWLPDWEADEAYKKNRVYLDNLAKGIPSSADLTQEQAKPYRSMEEFIQEAMERQKERSEKERGRIWAWNIAAMVRFRPLSL
jgi:hypothetical protein